METVEKNPEVAWSELVTKYRLRRPGHDEQGHFVRDDECLKVAGVLQQAGLELLATAAMQTAHEDGAGYAADAWIVLRLARAWLVEADRGQKSRGFPEAAAEELAETLAKEVSRGA